MPSVLGRLLPDRFRLPALLLAGVLCIAGGVWIASYAQREAATRVAGQARDVDLMLTAMLDQETGLRGFLLTHSDDFLKPYVIGRNDFDKALAAARETSEGDGSMDELIDRQESVARDWEARAERQIADVKAHGFESLGKGARARKAIMDRFRDANATLARQVETRRADQLDAAGGKAVAVILLLGFGFTALGMLLIRNTRRRRAREQDFANRLLMVRSETEAHELLREHVERAVPGSTVTVFTGSTMPDRLDPGAAYQPVLVGGEVLGSVVMRKPGTPTSMDTEKLAEIVSRAAPMLANLRHLAVAEERALTDALTKLPNRRAIQDTSKRLHAHAQRTGSPFSVVVADLDHFKRVNDTYGHDRGDETLVATAEALTRALRRSDFVGRMGGEEFIVLLPDTGADSAVMVAENLRRAIGEMRVPGVDSGITASFGVATFPDDGTGCDTLRLADRALYLAKDLGRDRVQRATGAPHMATSAV